MDNGKIISESLYDFIVEQNYSKEKYYHYTKMMNIGLIFGDKKQIRLGEITNLNDRTENMPNSFLFCISSSSVESIPFWYLYSGVRADGLRIGITSNGIQNLLKEKLYYYLNNNKIEILPNRIRLFPVLYYEKEETSDKEFKDKGLHRIKIDGKVFYVKLNQIENYKILDSLKLWNGAMKKNIG